MNVKIQIFYNFSSLKMDKTSEENKELLNIFNSLDVGLQVKLLRSIPEIASQTWKTKEYKDLSFADYYDKECNYDVSVNEVKSYINTTINPIIGLIITVGGLFKDIDIQATDFEIYENNTITMRYHVNMIGVNDFLIKLYMGGTLSFTQNERYRFDCNTLYNIYKLRKICQNHNRDYAKEKTITIFNLYVNEYIKQKNYYGLLYYLIINYRTFNLSLESIEQKTGRIKSIITDEQFELLKTMIKKLENFMSINLK